MPSKLPRLNIRIENKYKEKIAYIATKNGRSQNREVRQVLLRYIERYEQKYGEIKIDK